MKAAPLNIIILSLISGCSTASIMLSKAAVSSRPSNGVSDLYHEALSCRLLIRVVSVKKPTKNGRPL